MRILQRLVGATCTTAVAQGVLLWLASKDIHLEKWIAEMIGVVETNIATNQHIYLVLLGVFGMLGFAIGPAIFSKLQQLTGNPPDLPQQLNVQWPSISLRDARIPYVKIRQLANAKGWNLNDDSPACVNRAYYLEGQMQQAAVEGSLLVWGCKCEAPIGSNPLLLIPKKHFKDFTFRHGFLTRDNVENLSTYTWKPEPGKNRNSFSGENYCDLYVSERGIKRLLRRVTPSDGVVTSSS